MLKVQVKISLIILAQKKFMTLHLPGINGRMITMKMMSIMMMGLRKNPMMISS